MVSERERRHFAAIAAAERQSEKARIDEALRTPAGERILDGLRLGRAAVLTSAHLAEIDAQADGQMELARRRMALGLSAEE